METQDALTPTASTYQTLEAAYNFFNEQLFGSRLNPPLIILEHSKKAAGHFGGQRYIKRDDKSVRVNELMMNPDCFLDKPDREIFDTLLHEMCHAWQHQWGLKKSKNGNHNMEWARKMQEVGLMPSDTGKAGGKKIGKNVSHYIIPCGAYDLLYPKMAAQGIKLGYESKPEPKLVTERDEVWKYVCPNCGLQASGKEPRVVLPYLCNECYHFYKELHVMIVKPKKGGRS